MLNIYYIIILCLWQSSLLAMESTPAAISRGHASTPDVFPTTRYDAIKAELEAQHRYEYELEDKLERGQITQEEYNAYHEKHLRDTISQIFPKEPHIDAANNCGNTRLHLTVRFANAATPDSLKACRTLIRQGAHLNTKNILKQTPLYLAAVHKRSLAITTTLLYPSIQPTLETLLLCRKKGQFPIDIRVLRNILVHYIIFNAIQTQLAVLEPLLTEVLESTTLYRPNPMAGRNVPVIYKKKMGDLVEKNEELKALLDPKNKNVLKDLITKKLYASIALTPIPKEKDETKIA
ncbi:MAG: hypothetical protein AB7F19_00280 [Candidatus Babeliales bacterium]